MGRGSRSQHCAPVQESCSQSYSQSYSQSCDYSSLSCPAAPQGIVLNNSYGTPVPFEKTSPAFKQNVETLGTQNAPGLKELVDKYGATVDEKTNTITFKATIEQVPNIRLGLSDKDPTAWYGNQFSQIQLIRDGWTRDTGASGEGYSVKLNYEKDQYGRDTGNVTFKIQLSKDLHRARIDLGTQSYLLDPNNLVARSYEPVPSQITPPEPPVLQTPDIERSNHNREPQTSLAQPDINRNNLNRMDQVPEPSNMPPLDIQRSEHNNAAHSQPPVLTPPAIDRTELNASDVSPEYNPPAPDIVRDNLENSSTSSAASLPPPEIIRTELNNAEQTPEPLIQATPPEINRNDSNQALPRQASVPAPDILNNNSQNATQSQEPVTPPAAPDINTAEQNQATTTQVDLAAPPIQLDNSNNATQSQEPASPPAAPDINTAEQNQATTTQVDLATPPIQLDNSNNATQSQEPASPPAAPEVNTAEQSQATTTQVDLAAPPIQLDNSNNATQSQEPVTPPAAPDVNTAEQNQATTTQVDLAPPQVQLDSSQNATPAQSTEAQSSTTQDQTQSITLDYSSIASSILGKLESDNVDDHIAAYDEIKAQREKDGLENITNAYLQSNNQDFSAAVYQRASRQDEVIDAIEAIETPIYADALTGIYTELTSSAPDNKALLETIRFYASETDFETINSKWANLNLDGNKTDLIQEVASRMGKTSAEYKDFWENIVPKMWSSPPSYIADKSLEPSNTEAN